MLNKKILAAAVASAFSFNALAVVDLEATTSQTVLVASESVTSGDLNASGFVEVANVANVLNVTNQAGFTVATGTSKYARYDLVNATFGAVPSLASAVPGFSATISQGGAVGDNYVIFEVTSPTNDIPANDVFTLAAAQIDTSQTATSEVQYAFYETASQAVNETGALDTDSSTYLSVTAGSTGVFTVAGTGVGTVASGFLNYENGGATGETNLVAEIGQIDTTKVVSTTPTIKPDGSAFVATDVIAAAAQTITLDGDFTFGTWELRVANCAGAASALTLNTAKTQATISADPTANVWALCNTVNGTNQVIKKGTYEVALTTPALSNTIGTISYDTTSIEVPYLTTFSAYNQRIYIVNNGPTDALYTMTFTSESDATATAGTAASGTVPAGEMIAIKATDIVTLTGKTRTSAVIEIEATDGNVMAASQSVNLSTGATDTVVLN